MERYNKSKTKENSNVYDSIFSFIFDVQAKKERKKPVQDEELGEFSEALMEVGTQPLLFPLETAFASINDYISKSTEIDLGGGIKGGFGSGVLTDPNRYSNKEISKNRAKATWASVGGSVHYMTDGALFSLLARKNGLDSKTAMKTGRLYGDLLKEEMKRGEKSPNSSIFGGDFFPKGSEEKFSNQHLFGYTTDKDRQDIEQRLFREGIDVRVQNILQKNPQLDKKILMENVLEGQKYVSRGERIEKTRNILQMQGLDRAESENIATFLWGKQGSSDQGVFLLGEQQAVEGVDRILGVNTLKNEDKEKILNLLKEENDKQKRKEIYKVIRKNTDLNATLAFGLTQEIADLKINSSFDIAKDSIYYTLASSVTKRIAEASGIEEKDVPLDLVQNKVKGILDNTTKDTLGMRLEKGVLVLNWLSLSKTWGSVLLEGKWEKFSLPGLGFTEIVKEVEVKKEGKKTGEKYYASGDSVIGKILGGAYYLHPRNFIRGAFLDGSLWLKLASDGQGNLNTKSLAYLFYNLTPGKSFSVLAKPFKAIANKVTQFVNPFFEGIKRFTKNLLTKVLGATGVGALLVNIFMNFVSDRFAYIVNQIVLIVILGIIGILFILFESSGIMYSNEQIEAIIQGNPNETVVSDGIFSDSDWELVEDKD